MRRFIILSLFLFSAQAASASGDLRIISRSPSDYVPGVIKELTVAFSRPVIKLGEDKKPCPLALYKAEEPSSGRYPGAAAGKLSEDYFKKYIPVPGKCRWKGTQAVSFVPAAAVSPASVYMASVAKDFRSALSGESLSGTSSWFIQTGRPEVIASSPRNGMHWLGKNAEIYIAFSQRPDIGILKKAVTVKDKNGEEVPFTVRAARREEVDVLWKYYDEVHAENSAVIVPSGLKYDGTYKVVVHKDLPLSKDPLGMLKDYPVTFTTVNSFRIVSGPAPECLPPSASYITFSNPVTYAEFRKNLKIKPALRIADYSYRGDSYDGAYEYGDNAARQLIPGYDMKPGVTYTFRISGKIRDIFGNRLGGDAVFSYKAGDYCPSLSAEGGFGILESYLPARHPVSALNAAPVKLDKGIIKKEDFIPFYYSDKKKDPSGAAGKLWDPSRGAKNIRVDTFIDFSGGSVAGDRSFVFARLPLQHKEKYSPSEALIIDNITPLGITVKTSPENTLLRVTELKTGKAAAGVPVELRGRDNSLLWRGTSSDDGTVAAPGWNDLRLRADYGNPELWVFAEDKDGTAVMNSSWSEGIEPWRFRINYNYSPEPCVYGVKLFTERNLYRPGEKVYVKGILRKVADGKWGPAGFGDILLEVSDPSGNKIFSRREKLDREFSSFSSSFTLASSAPTGLWSYTVKDREKDNAVFSEGQFSVEEFRPASFEVRSASLEKKYYAGDSYKVATEGWYFFGAPMAWAKADWTLRLEPAFFTPKGWDGYDFSDEDDDDYSGDKLASGAAVLDSEGKFSVESELPGRLRCGRACWAVFEAGVYDAQNQSVFARELTLVHKSGVYLGYKAPEKTVLAGQPWSGFVVAVDPDGKPESVSADVNIYKRQWLSSRRAGLGGRLEWVSDKADSLVKSFRINVSTGPERINFVPKEGGSYYITLSSKDGKGRAARTSGTFYVAGKGDAWWAQENSDIVEMVPDKRIYRPGETARILVKSPWDKAEALITVEREGIMYSRVAELKGGSDYVEIPVKEEYMPNVFVSAVVYHGRVPAAAGAVNDDLSKPQARFGYAQFRVETADKRIKVSAETDRTDYRPGENVTVKLRAADAAGLPVRAEITLYAVDEGVLSLKNYTLPDPFSEFYGERPLAVLTADSRLHIIGQRSYGEKGESRGGGGGNSSGTDMRVNFDPVAYWNPSVVTGSDGEASAVFRLPDSLTRYRIMAVAASADSFGGAETEITVSKVLSLRRNMPRTVRPGDVFACGVTVFNYSDGTLKGKVKARASGSGVELTGEKTKTFSVPPGEAENVNWHCSAKGPGEASFEFRASAGKEKDALAAGIMSEESVVTVNEAVSGTLSAPGTLVELRRPAEKGTVSVELYPSVLGGLGASAERTAAGRFDCAEQNVSEAFSLLLGENFSGKKDRDSFEKAEKLLKELNENRAVSGGYCYFGRCDSADPYLTAYVLDALSYAGEQGAVTEAGGAGKAEDWLYGWLNSEGTADVYGAEDMYVSAAYAASVLAARGKDVRPALGKLYADRYGMSAEARAHLLTAFELSAYDAETAGKLRAYIESGAENEATYTFFSGRGDGRFLDSDVKTTGATLYSLLRSGKKYTYAVSAAKWLADSGKDGSWTGGQDAVWALRGLEAYYKVYESGKQDYKVSVSRKTGLKTAGLFSFAVSGKTAVPVKRVFPFEKIFGNSADGGIGLGFSGSGSAYYILRTSYVKSGKTGSYNGGFSLTREIRPLDGSAGLGSGRRAIVTLTVESESDRYFVALKDNLPGGFEIVNADLKSSSAKDAEILNDVTLNSSGFGDPVKSMNGITAFAEFLPAGKYKFSYIVQTNVPGKYSYPAARAECIYAPEIYGNTADETVEVLP